MNQNLQATLDSVRESFGRVVYTHKTHMKQADRLGVNASRLKWLEIILLAATTGTIISVVFGARIRAQIVSATLSSVALLVTVAQLKFNPEQVMQVHRACGNHLWGIRERYINLIADMSDGALDADEVRNRRDALVKELSQIYETAPATTAAAYADAQKALKESEEMTFSDEEIDKFLPKSLRKKP
jgi:hypothetical protein